MMAPQLRFDFNATTCQPLSPLLQPPTYDPGSRTSPPKDPHVFDAAEMHAIATAADDAALRSQPLGSLRSASSADHPSAQPM